MIRTFISILITAILLFSISLCDLLYVQHTFENFHQALDSLYQKAETQTATYQDGEAIRAFWEKRREALHIWLPHSSIQEIDLQLGEAIGYLHQENYGDSLAKIHVLLTISQLLPDSYTLQWKNIL